MPTSDKKISQLPEATTIQPGDLHVIVQSGVTKKITHSNQQASYLQSANNLSDVASVSTARDNLGILSEAETNQLIDNLFVEASIRPPSLPPIPFQNGFVNGASPLQMWCHGYHRRSINFRGQLDCSGVTFPSGQFVEILTMTTPFRPRVILHFPVIGLYGAIGLCAVHPDGKVYVKNLYGNLLDSGIIDFANVSYFIEPV